MRWLRPLLSVSLFAAALSLWNLSVASADGEIVNDGPVYLAVSLPDEFSLDTDENGDPVGGSPMLFVRIGTLIATDDVGTTTFESAEISSIDLPGDLTFTDLYFNAATVFGTVHTLPPPQGLPGEPHLITPVPDEIPFEIQAAVHSASTLQPGEGGFADLAGQVEPPPSAADLVNAVMAFIPLDTGGQPIYSAQEVFQHVLATNEVLRPTGDGQTLSVTSEGEMFPHDPAGPILIFSFTLQEDGDIASDVCAPISIDVMPGSDTNPINVKKKGDLPVALLTDGDFDAADVDPDTVTLGGVPADTTSLEDVDGDGDDDLVCHWDIPTLVEAGLTVDVDELFVVAELYDDGGCVAGHDDVDTFAKGK